MIAIDTNILCRFYIDDENDGKAMEQHVIAAHVLASPSVFISKSVLLEFAWVAENRYGLVAKKIMAMIAHLCGLENVEIEDHAAVESAISGCSKGLEFADALHLGSARNCEKFVTFDDQKFARRAQKLGLSPPCIVPG